MAKSLIGKMMNLQRPIPFNARWNATSGQLYGSYGSDRFTQLQAMGGTGTLFAIVQLLSQGQAKMKWGMYRHPVDGRVRYTNSDQGSDMREEVLKHQALKLWKRPNPFMTGNDFREIGWQFMELVGEWYWVMDRGPSGESFPLEMWPVRPDRMTPVPDKNDFLVGWVYTGPQGEEVPLAASEVIQLRYPNPADPYRGLSAVQALLADIDNARYSAEWSRNFFLNGATPGGIVTFAKRLTDDEFQEFTSRWREQHQGVARGHRVGVLEQGALWTPNTYSLRDMQFAELRNMSRDVIREAYRIHQAMLGLSDDVNRANAQTAEEVHIQWHEITRAERTANVLNDLYLPCFGSTGAGVEFDFKDPGYASANDANEELTAKSTAAQRLAAAGWDPAGVLETVGLPPMKFVGPPAPAGGGGAGFPRPSSGRPSSTEPNQSHQNEPGEGQPENRIPGYKSPSDLSLWSEDDVLDLAGIIRQQFREVLGNGNGHARR
jgi:HK97 family phage portal protein